MNRPAAIPPEYEILGELGRGTSGIVYKARYKPVNRIIIFAIKILSPESRTDREASLRFLREAQVLVRLTSERRPIRGIPSLYIVSRYQGVPYHGREYVEGTTLEQRVMNGTIRLGEGLAVVIGVARTIHEIHGRGFVHRNLHPSNILIANDGTPRLIGFGRVGLRPGVVERFDGIAVCPPDVDVEQLGRMLTWLCAGVIDRGKEAIHPPGLEVICQRCSAAHSAGNYFSAAMLADELVNLLNDRHTSHRPLS